MQQGQRLPAPLRRTHHLRRDTLLRAAVIVAVLALSAILALFTPAPGGRNAMVLLALPLVAVGGLFLLRKPGLGVILLVAAGLVVPFSIGTGTGTTLNPTVMLIPALTGLWLFDMVIRQKSVRLHHHPAVYLVLALCVVAILALIAGQLPWFNIPGAGFASQLGGLMVFLLSAAAFLLSAHVLDERRLQQLVAIFLVIAAAYMVTRVLPGFGFVQRLFVTGSAGSVFWIWTVALSAGMALFYDGLRPLLRVALGGLAILTLLVALTQALVWASGWAPPAVALLLLVWLRFPRWGWMPILLATVGAVVRQETFFQVATDTQQWFARRQAWQIVLDAAMANPLLGLGPSNYYFIVQQYDIGGWGGVWNVKFNSHNNFVDIIAQTGLIGLGVFLAFAAVMGRVGWKLYRRLPDSFARAYAAACLAGLVATLVSGMLGDWFLPFVYNIGLTGMRSSILFWVFLGGLLALQSTE